MGYNTTLIVLNDALHEIENDPEFGKKVASAIRMLARGKPVNISSGNHCNVATAIETHHADQIHMVAIGGNYGKDLGYVGGYTCDDIGLLEGLAGRLGYSIRKKPVKKEVV